MGKQRDTSSPEPDTVADVDQYFAVATTAPNHGGRTGPHTKLVARMFDAAWQKVGQWLVLDWKPTETKERIYRCLCVPFRLYVERHTDSRFTCSYRIETKTRKLYFRIIPKNEKGNSFRTGISHRSRTRDEEPILALGAGGNDIPIGYSASPRDPFGLGNGVAPPKAGGG